MARIRLAYIGGGSTRAPGTMASFIERGERFVGSEVVLFDLDAERLAIVRSIAERMINHRGLDLRVSSTTDRCSALQDCDAVLTSYRPGGFEARHLDESIPLRYGVIGQETQGPGGFFMALRSIHVMKGIVAEMERLCPEALLVNYTNPVNIVSQAVVAHSDVRIVSLCEGPIIFPRMVARAAGLDPDGVEAVMIGLNHGCWSVQHTYRGEDLIPLVERAWLAKRDDNDTSTFAKRLLQLTASLGSIPASYFLYYYFTEDILAELRAAGHTRAQEIMSNVGEYWSHYSEQARSTSPELDPQRSRGGIHELELAIDVLDAHFNDQGTVWPVNVRNGGVIPDLPDDCVVEIPAIVDRQGIHPVSYGALPRQAAGLVRMLASYQMLTAAAGWCGARNDAVRALMDHPWVTSPSLADALYTEMSAAQAQYLPGRLVA